MTLYRVEVNVGPDFRDPYQVASVFYSALNGVGVESGILDTSRSYDCAYTGHLTFRQAEDVVGALNRREGYTAKSIDLTDWGQLSRERIISRR